MRRILALAFAGLAFVVASDANEKRADARDVISSSNAVTVYSATWCPACKVLEHDLRERNVPFAMIDVDASPRDFEVAKRATGQNAIPQTSITRPQDDRVTWIVGADSDAVEKAYRGE